MKDAVEDWHARASCPACSGGTNPIWTSADEDKRLGWLDSVDLSLKQVPDYQAFAQDVKRAAFTNVLLLGMGGSSLGPEVSALTFGNQSGWPTLRIPRFDRSGTDQGDRSRDRHDANAVHRVQQVRQHERAERAEGLFFARVLEAVGKDKAGGQSSRHRPRLRRWTRPRGRPFPWRLPGAPNIGGHYLVLSPFGLVPASASGVDVARLLETAQAMVRSCGGDVPPADNPAVQLGVAGREERDKVTLFSSPKLVDFGAWAEQRRVDRKEW